MSTTRQDISRWFDDGVAKGATHMAVIRDTYDYDDFPRYIMPGQNVRQVTKNLGSMERLMEVYALHIPKEDQLNERRSFHYEEPGR